MEGDDGLVRDGRWLDPYEPIAIDPWDHNRGVKCVQRATKDYPLPGILARLCFVAYIICPAVFFLLSFLGSIWLAYSTDTSFDVCLSFLLEQLTFSTLLPPETSAAVLAELAELPDASKSSSLTCLILAQLVQLIVLSTFVGLAALWAEFAVPIPEELFKVRQGTRVHHPEKGDGGVDEIIELKAHDASGRQYEPHHHHIHSVTEFGAGAFTRSCQSCLTLAPANPTR